MHIAIRQNFDGRIQPEVFPSCNKDKKYCWGTGPMNVIATMNAGNIPPNAWVHDMKVGGGRIIGEACHFIDLITFLTGSKVHAVCMNAMGINPETIQIMHPFY